VSRVPASIAEVLCTVKTFSHVRAIKTSHKIGLLINLFLRSTLSTNNERTLLELLIMPLTWLVTGCTSGLGEALVQGVLARGDKVIATSRGDTSRLSGLAQAGAKTFSLDVTAPQAEIDTIIGKILHEGPIDVLVNNAGYIEAALAEEAT
jgi:NADPH:quinone reductase-like Zn-dependent oxidoreductase